MNPEVELEACMRDDESDYKEKLCNKYSRLLNHLDAVQKFCRALAYELIQEGEYGLAHNLVVAGQEHDLSKFADDEWEYLCEYTGGEQSEKLKSVIRHHVTHNSHHPEAHKSIHDMPDCDLAEMLMDWVARGQEFGIPVYQFLAEKGYKKYGFDRNSEVFRKLNKWHAMIMGHGILNIQ